METEWNITHAKTHPRKNIEAEFLENAYTIQTPSKSVYYGKFPTLPSEIRYGTPCLCLRRLTGNTISAGVLCVRVPEYINKPAVFRTSRRVQVCGKRGERKSGEQCVCNVSTHGRFSTQVSMTPSRGGHCLRCVCVPPFALRNLTPKRHITGCDTVWVISYGMR